MQRILRVLLFVACGAVAGLVAGSANANCQCHCGAYTSGGNSLPFNIPGVNVPGTNWNFCSGSTNAKASSCKLACLQDVALDVAHWGNDAWLCNAIGGNFEPEIQARSKIVGTFTFGDSRVTQKPLHCKKCPVCPAWPPNGHYNSTMGMCYNPAIFITIKGLPDGDKGGGWYALDGLLYENWPSSGTEVRVGTHC